MKKLLWTVAACVMAIGASLVAANPAAASDSEHGMYTSDGGVRGGQMYFKEHGDYVEVVDRHADGKRVILEVWWGSRLRYTLEASGAGDYDYTDHTEHNMPENTNITFIMYLYDASNGGATSGIAGDTWYNDY